MDFDDLLVRTVNVLELFEDVRERYRRAFRWVLVDEYQDTNRAQYRLLQLLARGARKPVRGRRRRPVDLRLPRRRHPQHPRVRARLPRGRGGEAGAELPLHADDPRRRQRGDRQQPRTEPKRLWTDGGQGEPIKVAELDDEHAEARWVAGEIERLVTEEGVRRDEIAVFYRTNAQSRVLEDTLVRFEIPYQVIGGTKFYERAEIKDAVAYLSLLINPADAISFARVVNSPRRGIGHTSQARLLSHANTTGAADLGGRRPPEAVPGLGAAAMKAVRRFAETIEGLRAARRVAGAGRRAAGGAAARRPATSRRSRPSARSRPRAGSRTSQELVGVAGRVRRQPRARGRRRGGAARGVPASRSRSTPTRTRSARRSRW